MDESLQQRLKSLVSSDASLLSIVDELRRMRDAGFEREAVRNALEALRKESKSEAEEDRIMDVMDFVVGWCAPRNRIWD